MDTGQARKQIGEILVEKGLVTKVQVAEALSRQQNHQPEEKIGEILVEMGYVTMTDVVQAYAEQVLMMYGDIDEDEDILPVDIP